MPGEPRITPIERFQSKCSPAANGCLEYTAESKTPNGYGVFSVRGKQTTAHRWIYEWVYGKQHGLDVRHDCDNRKCVWIGHLRHGTRTQNMADAKQRKRLNVHHPKMAGQRHHKATITDDQALEIRRRNAAGETIAEIRKSIPVSYMTVYRVIRRETFIHLSE